MLFMRTPYIYTHTHIHIAVHSVMPHLADVGLHLSSPGGPNTSEPTSLSNDRGQQTADNIRYGQNISESGVGGKTTTSTGSAEQAGGYGGKSDEAEPQKQTRREQGYGPGSGVGA
jgi:hypothetical protein